MTIASLSPKQRLFVQALITHGGDVSRAADAVGIGRSTGFRWVALEAVTQALREADREVLVATSRRLARISGKAVQVLLVLMSDPATPPGVRVRAADAALSKALQLRETVDIEERLSALEAQAAQEERDRG